MWSSIIKNDLRPSTLVKMTIDLARALNIYEMDQGNLQPEDHVEMREAYEVLLSLIETKISKEYMMEHCQAPDW